LRNFVDLVRMAFHDWARTAQFRDNQAHGQPYEEPTQRRKDEVEAQRLGKAMAVRGRVHRRESEAYCNGQLDMWNETRDDDRRTPHERRPRPRKGPWGAVEEVGEEGNTSHSACARDGWQPIVRGGGGGASARGSPGIAVGEPAPLVAKRA
jgi:hypothetical protein